jgi:hypothetical protein
MAVPTKKMPVDQARRLTSPGDRDPEWAEKLRRRREESRKVADKILAKPLRKR